MTNELRTKLATFLASGHELLVAWEKAREKDPEVLVADYPFSESFEEVLDRVGTWKATWVSPENPPTCDHLECGIEGATWWPCKEAERQRRAEVDFYCPRMQSDPPGE